LLRSPTRGTEVALSSLDAAEEEVVMKILVGVDDSPCSRAALETIKRIRWPVGTQVTVVSAVPVPTAVYADVYVPGGSAEAYSEIMEIERRRHEELVARIEQELRDHGLATRAEVLPGDPREAIVDAAKRDGIDLVVVGSHGRAGLAKLLMGSVASHVVTHAPCSVLVVREPAAKSTRSQAEGR